MAFMLRVGWAYTAGIITFSKAVVRESRLKFWKTKPMRLFRSVARSAALNLATSSPAM